MARPTSKHPTELELEILKILWRDGPVTVRQTRDALVAVRDLAYTSVMTVMTIMVKKGYLSRHKSGPGYVYQAKVSEAATTRKMLGDLIDRAFDGSAASLLVSLLETKDIDAEELKRLRALINRKAKE